MTQKENLLEAQEKAFLLFQEIEAQKLIHAGKSELSLNQEIWDLAREKFGIETFWHKRIVRSGTNTTAPYNENPPNLMIQPDDLVFLDVGPVLENWEADLGRSYAIGNDVLKHRLVSDIETAWYAGKQYFDAHPARTGAELYTFIGSVAESMGWIFEAEMAGHLIGNFPHSKIFGQEIANYIHPENHEPLRNPDPSGQPRDWILEIHFLDLQKKYGGFFEQLLT